MVLVKKVIDIMDIDIEVVVVVELSAVDIVDMSMIANFVWSWQG